MNVETKAVDHSHEMKGAMHEFLTSFEEFKSANDQRLTEIEKKNNADPLLEEKVDRLDAALTAQKSALDEIVLKAQRPIIGGLSSSPNMTEQKTAFDRYVRLGDSTALESKGLTGVTDPEGGYLAPTETEAMITAAVRDVSPIRQIASVRQIGSNTFRKPISTSGAVAGWVGETDVRPETATPGLAAVDFPTMELYAMPAITQTLLDDAVVNIEQWLADEVQAEFATQEGAAFVSGDGLSKPKGFLSYPVVAEGTNSWGELGYIATGTDGDFDVTNPADSLVDLIYAPKQIYRTNGRFVMARTVVSKLRKMKDAEGNYLWQPSTQAGIPASLMGFPVTESEDMPGISADSHSIVFGDFERGYLIVDRVGIRVLRDPYSAKPYVLFYTTKRVGGGVQNFDALKVLKFSAS